MLTPDDIRNPRTKSGYRGVGTLPRSNRVYYQAQAYGGSLSIANHAYRGPCRKDPRDAAQDYCDFVNANRTARRPAALKSAGHKRPQRRSQTVPAEVAAARGVLRDWAAQKKDKQGYIYLIAEVAGLPYGAVKVGYSTNPLRRPAELQTGNPRRLHLVAHKPGTEADEAALHAKYIKQNILQEWFRPTEGLLSEFGITPSASNERSATTT